MPANRELVTQAFAAWSHGTGYVTSIFAEDMTWEIVGHSAASRRYATRQEFIDEVLAPFGARFSAEQPFRPVNIRGIFADDASSTIIVLWDDEDRDAVRKHVCLVHDAPTTDAPPTSAAPPSPARATVPAGANAALPELVPKRAPAQRRPWLAPAQEERLPR